MLADVIGRAGHPVRAGRHARPRARGRASRSVMRSSRTAAPSSGTVVEVGRDLQLRAPHQRHALAWSSGSIPRTRATGQVTGRLSSPLAMSDIESTDDVEVGDRVVTAGIAEGRQLPVALPARASHRPDHRRPARAGSRSCRPRSSSPRPTSTTSRTCSSSPTTSRRSTRPRHPRRPCRRDAGARTRLGAWAWRSRSGPSRWGAVDLLGMVGPARSDDPSPDHVDLTDRPAPERSARSAEARPR